MKWIDRLREAWHGGPKGVCYPHDRAFIRKDRKLFRLARCRRESAVSRQPINCLNCKFFDDFEDGDLMGYCGHPIHGRNEHRLYGGHWTHEQDRCSMWRPSGEFKADRVERDDDQPASLDIGGETKP